MKANKKMLKQDRACNYCKKKGHWVRDCRKWIADGRPPKNKEVSDPQGNLVELKETLFLTAGEEVCSTDVNRVDWWIDNGATSHITNDSSFFIDFKEFKSPCIIKAAGKETLKTLGKGTIKVVSTINNKDKILSLTDVWYIPDISKNLFSVLAT